MTIEFDVWWILIAVALFAAGWFAARVDIKLLVKESRTLPGWYFKGLNHLLNSQPDKAIESFVEVVNERPDTLELQFALGQLFRKQGQIDRATRIHQELLSRPHLADDHRQRALYELAQDYNAAGLLDRAEECFTQLNGTQHEHAALAFLIRIYEMEKDWNKALEATHRLEAATKQPYQKQRAQYHCELASVALVKRDFAQVLTHAKAAIRENKQCVRANVLLGDAARAQGDVAGAIVAWEAIESQMPDALGLVAARLASAYLTVNRADDGIAVLSHFQHDYPSQDVLSACLDLLRKAKGDGPTAAFLRDELKRTPTLSGLEQLLSMNASGAVGADADLARDVVRTNTRAAGTYPCTRCGFRARTYYWQCPGCVQWESFAPRRQEAMDVR